LCTDDEGETKHLCDLHGVATHLHFFQIDILDYSSLLAAIRSPAGVFYLASPCGSRPRSRGLVPGELLDPAVKGTVNVLCAAKECRVRRVVVTSSISAIIPSPGWPANIIKDEECLVDVDYCKENEAFEYIKSTRLLPLGRLRSRKRETHSLHPLKKKATILLSGSRRRQVTRCVRRRHCKGRDKGGDKVSIAIRCRDKEGDHESVAF
ncbi:hypothetical protein Taro_033723, partial [Colocasia esculenta]|nr:hypothetical protein [Colocasia esculenta]